MSWHGGMIRTGAFRTFSSCTWLLALLAAAGAGCARTPGEIAEKVAYDFGIGERPEGYVSGSDRVMENLTQVAEVEMKRMNMAQRHGEVEFQDEGGLRGSYYKEVKTYESFYPLDARAVSKSVDGDRGFIGYIEYTYRIYQSERKANRTEAAAESASIATPETGRDTFRYRFSSGGNWDGRPGELTRQ